MQLSTFLQVRTNFNTAYDAVHGAGSAEALPPGLISAILQAIFAALGGGCMPTPTPATVKGAIADPLNEPYLVFLVRRELVESLGRTAAKQVNAVWVVTAMKSGVASSDDATIQGVLNAA